MYIIEYEIKEKNHVLFLSEKQNTVLKEFEEKMDRYAYHISRWLEYEGEIPSED